MHSVWGVVWWTSRGRGSARRNPSSIEYDQKARFLPNLTFPEVRRGRPLLTDEEIEDLNLLIQGIRKPRPGIEQHFVQVMKGRARPCSPKETEWFYHWRCFTLVLERERTVAALDQRIASLKQESEKLAHVNEILRNENTKLKISLVGSRKYEPVGIPREPAPKWESCHQCGGDGGVDGRCPRCGGDGFEP